MDTWMRQAPVLVAILLALGSVLLSSPALLAQTQQQAVPPQQADPSITTKTTTVGTTTTTMDSTTATSPAKPLPDATVTASRSTDRASSLPNWCSIGTYARGGELLLSTMTRTEPSHKVYHNAYWHTHKWYALITPDSHGNSSTSTSAEGPAASDSSSNHPGLGSSTLEEGLSVNTALVSLPLSNISAFSDNLRAGFLPGTTLLVDFPFPAFPDNLGHWAEVMITTYSVLADGAWRGNLVGGRGAFVDRIMLPNLRKVRATLWVVSWGWGPYGARNGS